MTDFHPPMAAVRTVVAAALAEDLLPLGDITAALVPEAVMCSARFVSRQPGVMAGARSAGEAFFQLDPEVEVLWMMDDGFAVRPGDVIGTVKGRLRSVLTAERTALNLLCHLSGVATLTRRYADAVAAGDQHCRIRDTRKTTPGLRSLEKAAVRAGGGLNHRANLSESVLVKDNHLGGLTIPEAVATARDRWPGRTVEVECDDLDQVKLALEAAPDMVLLDNFTPDQAADAVELVRGARGPGTRPLIEVSGRVTLESAGAYARAGVDYVSVGALTHSAPVLDIGLDLGA